MTLYGNWSAVTAAGEYIKLPVGGYVCKIVDARNDERNERVEIVYDIAEGEFTGHFAGEDDWRHTYKKSHKEKAAPFFKRFLDNLEVSNLGSFNIVRWVADGCKAEDFIGLEFGGLFQERMYTNAHGEDKTVIDLMDDVASQDIRAGSFKLPPVKDSRTGISNSNGGDIHDDIPFF